MICGSLGMYWCEICLVIERKGQRLRMLKNKELS